MTSPGHTRSGVDTSAPIAQCAARGARTGFVGVVKHGHVDVASLCSCGQRHREKDNAVEAARGVPLAVGVFAGAGRIAETWVCPRTGELGRGPLSQIPLFYSVAGGAVRFSTDLAELVDRATPPWPAAVAAALDGAALSAPLTPYADVFQLSCGTILKVTGEKERLELVELDLAELAEHARRLVGRATPVRTLQLALAHAGADALGGAADGRMAGGLLGDGGGLGAAAVAAACGDRLRRVHVHLGVPVLDRRAARLLPGATVLDGTPVWLRTCDDAGLRYPYEADLWPLGPDLLGMLGTRQVRLLSGGALARAVAGPPAAHGRLRAGWVRLAGVSPAPALYGRRGWRAWRLPERPAPGTAPGTGPGTASGPGPAAAAEDHVLRGEVREVLEPGGWMSQTARATRAPVSAAETASHLVPGKGTGATLSAVIDALESTPLPIPGGPGGPGDLGGPGASGSGPVLVCAHPVVVGAIARLALEGRLRRRLWRGHVDPAPVLRDLVPRQWRPADVTPAEREKLLAAAFVTRALATPAQRTRLLDRVAASPWIDADRLRAVLADPRKVLFDAPALHRLCVTANRYGEAMHEGHEEVAR